MTFQNAGGINDFMAAETTHEFETAAETTHMVTEMTQRLCETREPVNDEYRHPRAGVQTFQNMKTKRMIRKALRMIANHHWF